MWIIIIIIIAFFIIRAIYINSGTYAVIDILGLIWKTGTYKECKNWVRTLGDGNFDHYKIRRVSQ